jgi:hypothetical protein
MKPPPPFHDPASESSPWVVVDAAGKPALWRRRSQLGRAPLRFKSQADAQVAADQLNAETTTKR